MMNDLEKEKLKEETEKLNEEFFKEEATLEGKKNFYLHRIYKTSDPISIFKYVYLFNSVALDSYIYQTRKQAKESFNVAKKISITGFILIACGVIIGFVLPLLFDFKVNDFIAGLTTVSGIITEIIAGTIFILYWKALKQFNKVIDEITKAQSESLDVIAKQIK